MTSKRRHPQYGRDERWWDESPWDWHPWATAAAIIVVLGILVYSCSGVAGAEPTKKWDLYHWIWPAPPTPPQMPPVLAPAPPSVSSTPAPAPPSPEVVAPPIAPTQPPVAPEPPPVVVQPPPFDPPPSIKPPAAPLIVLPPPQTQPQPKFKEKAKKIERGKEANNKPSKPPKSKQKAGEAETNEYLPPCSLVCWYAGGKTRAQLEAEAASRNPTARMRRHALACLAGCSK